MESIFDSTGQLNTARLFAPVGPVIRPGDNMRIGGVNGVYTLNGEAGGAEEQAAETLAEFIGCWFPSAVDSTHISLTAGSISDGGTTYTPSVSSVTVHASSLNYVYLECNITRTLVDSIVTGGTIDAAAIAAYTTTKTNTNTKGYVLLCTWQAGRLVDRYAYYSMQAELINNGGDALFRTWVSS